MKTQLITFLKKRIWITYIFIQIMITQRKRHQGFIYVFFPRFFFFFFLYKEAIHLMHEYIMHFLNTQITHQQLVLHKK